MPGLRLRYVADTAFFPYGGRAEDEVAARALTLGEQLAGEGCDLLVVACNTATSAALEAMRTRLGIPIVGMEPPLKPAVERTRSGRVVVLATEGTARGSRLSRLNAAHGANVHVDTIPMPGLAALVESGEVDGARVEAQLTEALAGPLAAGADAIALGCTHYGFLRAAVERCAPGVEVIDAAAAVARRVAQQLQERGLEVPDGPPAPLECSATGDAEAFAAVVERLRAAGIALPVIEFVETPATTANRRKASA